MEISLGTNRNVDPRHFREFVGRLYGAYPTLVNTKIEAYLMTVDAADPAHRFGTPTHIGVYDQGQLYAHASVVIDERKNNVLFVGHVECGEDDAANTLLFSGVEEYARERGVRSIVGPVDRNLWRTFRAPTSGMGAPFFSEPYLSMHAGESFIKSEYDVLQESVSLLAHIHATKSIARSESRFTCQRTSATEIPRILPSLFRIAARAFQDTPHFFEISYDEFLYTFLHSHEFAKRSMLFVATTDGGEVVGFLLGYRSPEASPAGVVAKTMAILPEFRRRGIARELFRCFYADALAEGFENVYYSTMRKDNKDIATLIGGGGSTPQLMRTYALFEKKL